MKAVILAAGLGTRLRPLGLDVPKVMAPVGGKPLLQHHIEMLSAQGVREFIVNLHHLPDRITRAFGDGDRYGVHIQYSHEPDLMGTAGGVKRMEPWLRDGTFLVVHGDNLMRFELAPLVAFHRGRRARATVALFESSEPWTGGIVETDPTGRVRRFVEKPAPEVMAGTLINAGIYLLEPAVLAAIPGGQFCDFGRDVFPALVSSGQSVYAMQPKAYIQDIGTPERLARAQRDWENGLVMR